MQAYKHKYIITTYIHTHICTYYYVSEITQKFYISMQTQVAILNSVNSDIINESYKPIFDR